MRQLAQAQCFPDLARHLDADDVVPSAFASLFRAVRSGLYDVPEGEDLWKLFLVIALNKIRAKRAYHRAAKRDMRWTHSGDCLNGSNGVAARADEDSSKFLKRTIDEAVESLAYPHAEIAYLRMEGYGVAEIAAKVKRSKRTVERSLQALRQRLGQRLDEGVGTLPGQS